MGCSEDPQEGSTISGGSLPIAVTLCAIVVVANVIGWCRSPREETATIVSAAELRILPPIPSMSPSALELAHCMGKCKDD